MIQTHSKKRLEIIVEAPMLTRLLHRLDQSDVTGYTVLPAIAGKGLSAGSWQSEGLVSDTGRMLLVICIVDPSRIDKVLETAYELVSMQIGIVSVSDVMVVRAEHF